LVKKVLVKSGEPHDGEEYWLAKDRNYLPVRLLAYTYRFSKDMPVGEGVVHKFREIKPGVWFPSDVEVTAYNKFKIQQEGRRELQWRERYTIKRVNLDPKYDREFFAKVAFPAGTAVYEVEKGQIVRSWRQGAPGTEPAKDEVPALAKEIVTGSGPISHRAGRSTALFPARFRRPGVSGYYPVDRNQSVPGDHRHDDRTGGSAAAAGVQVRGGREQRPARRRGPPRALRRPA
jgi:hypothetical protein